MESIKRPYPSDKRRIHRLRLEQTCREARDSRRGKEHHHGHHGTFGCGKSTLLRAVNRMHELYKAIHVTGEILLNGENILLMHPTEERRRVGMVFQRPNPFPTMNIYDNVLAGYILNGIKLSKGEKDEIVERNLRNVMLWDEVKDSLTKRGTFLSGGQQQRLCIARSLALQPDILLMDEPTSALDPIATKYIEDLLVQLKNEVTIMIVTHNMSQANASLTIPCSCIWANSSSTMTPV